MKLTMVDKALDFINTKIADGTWPDGTRMPTLIILAKMANVGQKAMSQALHILKKKGTLSFKEGVGIYSGAQIPVTAIQKSDPIKQPFWQHIKNNLLKDLFADNFHDFTFLPSSKELCSIYGTSFRTLHKIIRSCVDDGTLKYKKRKFEIVRSATTSTKRLFVCISNQFFRQEIVQLDKRYYFEEFYSSLEKECSQKNIALTIHQFGEPFEKTEINELVVGFILWQTLDLNPANITFSTYLKHFQKPVAVFLDPGDTDENIRLKLDYFSLKAGFFVSNMHYDFTAGLEMGKLLIAKGHRKISFFIPWHHFSYQSRYKGLKEAFSTMGIPDGVVLFNYADLSELEKKSTLLKMDLEKSRQIEGHLQYIDKINTDIAKKLPGPFSKKLTLQNSIIRSAMNRRIFYTPLFRQALTIKNCTAWICSEDSYAVYGALEFLKNEKIAVPGKIGVAGFEDMSESKLSNLTTYHFDFAGLARKMLTLVMYPTFAKKTFCRKGTTLFDVDGMIIDRGSIYP